MILAHLGSGASLAAVRGAGRLDTTMGFTPTAGLVMGTRTGDLDPGLSASWRRPRGLSAEQFDRWSTTSPACSASRRPAPTCATCWPGEADDPRAAEAIELFCYQVRRRDRRLAAALGGLDTLVFAGGIGENCARGPPPDLRGPGIPRAHPGRRPQRGRRPVDLGRCEPGPRAGHPHRRRIDDRAGRPLGDRMASGAASVAGDESNTPEEETHPWTLDA